MKKERLQQLAGILNENHFALIASPMIKGTPAIGNPFHDYDDHDDDDDYEMKSYDMKSMYHDSAPDMEIGHTDDEVNMIKGDLKTMCEDVKCLYDIVCELSKTGQEVDFPHWWQAKIILAKDYVSKAADYLKQETNSKY